MESRNRLGWYSVFVAFLLIAAAVAVQPATHPTQVTEVSLRE